MKTKWFVLFVWLFVWFGVVGCSQIELGINTGEVEFVAKSYDKAGGETFSSKTTLRSIESKTTVHPWAIVVDVGGGAIDSLKWLGVKLGIG